MESFPDAAPRSTPDVLIRREVPATSIRERDFLVMEPLLQWLRETASQFVRGVLLDYGCGNMPYRRFFERRCAEYIGVDVEQNRAGSVAHVVVPGGILPLPDASVDTVLSTQVLEHTADPDRYLSEAARVLKPGGYLLLTCPGSYMLHEEPHDFYRYTVYGLHAMAERHGMQVIRIDQAGGAWRVMGLTYLNHKTYYRRKRIPLFGAVAYRILVPVVNAACAAADRAWYNDKETTNYMMVAQRITR